MLEMTSHPVPHMTSPLTLKPPPGSACQWIASPKAHDGHRASFAFLPELTACLAHSPGIFLALCSKVHPILQFLKANLALVMKIKRDDYFSQEAPASYQSTPWPPEKKTTYSWLPSPTNHLQPSTTTPCLASPTHSHHSSWLNRIPLIFTCTWLNYQFIISNNITALR